MKETIPLSFPRDWTGRTAGFLLLALVPLVTLIPYEPLPVYLTQDLVLRWASLFVFLLCVLQTLSRTKILSSLHLDIFNILILLLGGWVLLSVKNSQQAFNSFYAFKSFLALVLFWFSFRMIWERWGELYAWFERIFFLTALAAGLWVFITTAGRWFWFDFFSRIVPREGPFPNPNIAAGFLGLALIWGVHKWLNLEKDIPGGSGVLTGLLGSDGEPGRFCRPGGDLYPLPGPSHEGDRKTSF